MIRALDRHLIVLLGLVALAGILLMRLPGEFDRATAAETPRLPISIGQWQGTEGAPESVLPNDPRAFAALRRTYTHGPRTVWLSVASYAALNEPANRPAIFLIAPARGAASIARDELTWSVNGDPRRTINRIAVRHPDRELAILYWYELADRVVRSEYELRLRLMTNRLLGRHQPLLLVRVASHDRLAAEVVVQALHRHVLAQAGRP